MLLPSALGSSPHPPVSVYGTGFSNTIADFLDTRTLRLQYSNFPPHHSFAYRVVLLSLILLSLVVFFHYTILLSSCVPTFLITKGAGIFTSCPSTTRLRLALGPDLPRADKLDSGNLGYSAFKILT